MNYILSYNYCNLNRVEYSGTDITCISDVVLSEAGIVQIVNRTLLLIEVISIQLQSNFIYFCTIPA